MDDSVVIDLPSQDVCPICFEGEKLHFLTCNHYIHLECSRYLTDPSCPLCRKPLENLPNEIMESIHEKQAKYKADLEEEDHRMAQENTIGRMFSIYVNPTIQVELKYAMNYLRNRGVPLMYLPQCIRVKVPEGQPKPGPGVLFSTLVGQVLERMRTHIASFDSDSSDSDSDSDSNPFENENRILERLQRITVTPMNLRSQFRSD